jgi:hypothetical protein
MKTLNIVLCNENDLDILTELDRLKIIEEKGLIKASNQEIKERLLNQMQRGISAYFLKWDSDVVGFAMVDTTRKPYKLKSFYASRCFRRSGMKALDFRKLVDILETDVLDVEVYTSNASGRLFWETFGFKERAVCLRYNNSGTVN